MERKKLLIGIFLSLILISSTLGFVLSYTNFKNDDQASKSGEININGIKIQESQTGVFYVDNNGVKVVFNYLPDDLKDINVSKPNFLTDKVYIIFDPEEKDDNLDYLLGKISLGLNSANFKTVLACSKEENCNIDVPVKDCSSYAVYIKKDNESKAYNMDKCLILQGDNTNLNMLVDKINYKLLG